MNKMWELQLFNIHHKFHIYNIHLVWSMCSEKQRVVIDSSSVSLITHKPGSLSFFIFLLRSQLSNVRLGFLQIFLRALQHFFQSLFLLISVKFQSFFNLSHTFSLICKLKVFLYFVWHNPPLPHKFYKPSLICHFPVLFPPLFGLTHSFSFPSER